MNKLILILSLTMIGCTTNIVDTRTVLDCSDLTTDPQMVPKNQRKGCTYQQVPIAPKAVPLEVRPDLIDKNQNR